MWRARNAAQQHKGFNVAQGYTQPSAIEEPASPTQREPAWEPAHVGNGAAREEQEETEVDTVAAGMAGAAHDADQEGPAEADEDEAESEQQKGSFAQRFSSPAERPSARASPAAPLGDRLKSLVAERPKT